MDSDRNHLEPRRIKSFSSQSSVSSSLRHSLSRSLHLQIDDDGDCENLSEAGDTGDLSLRRKHGIGRRSQTSVGSSLRHSLSRSLHLQIDDDVDSENVSEAGDTGDLSLRRKHGIGRSSYSSAGDGIEQGTASSVQEQDVLQSALWAHEPGSLNTSSVIAPLPEDLTSPLPTKSLLSSVANNEEKTEEWVLPKSLGYISCLIHLAVFGILGVITRYLLQKLFGPSGARVTSDGSILYIDLPSNIVGSFLMGWFGVVFKADIASVSEFLAIGLSTGYLGCLTTFSGWNQKMLDLSASGQWVYALLGFLVGLFLTAYSIIFGVETAKGFRWILHKRQKRDSCLKVNTFSSHIVSLILMLLLLAAFLSTSAFLLSKEFNKGTSEAQLWLGCLVAAPGVWLRWFLARLNGCGLGKDGQNFKWIPFGTLIANVAAACVMASLATLKKSVNTRTCNTVASSIQLGLLGSLSTVSTMMAEFNAMRESDYPWRAYVYASFTIAVSFALGTVIYSVPVWVVGFS